MIHKHKCRLCDTIWEHEQRDDVSNKEYHKLHNCPTCGENQREVYLTTKAETDAWRDNQRKRNPELAFILDLLTLLRELDTEQ